MFNYLIQRNEIYYYFRRVPEDVAHLDKRKFARYSLKTKDKKTAIRKSTLRDEYMEQYWQNLKEGSKSNPFEDYELATKCAKMHGFPYKNTEEISLEAVNEVVKRMNKASTAIDCPETVSSVLGGIDQPKLFIGGCIDRYWPLCSDRLTNKSEHQIRKWKNPRRAAFERFVLSTGERKTIQNIERSDIIKFRNSLREHIEKKEIVGDTANKLMGYTRDILHTLSIEYEIDIDFKRLFSDLKFKVKKVSRPPFEAQYVQDCYLKGNNLSRMNFEARMLLYAMCDTGARESELIGLRSEDIFLDGDIPFIWIQPYKDHDLKTPQSERKIPLVGASLFAFNQLPHGFQHYTNPDTASSTVNKFLRENNLKPSSSHSLYSLRHTFKDRLRDAEAPEEIIDELMGHKKKGPKYGRGHLIEKKYKWMQEIAFTPPVE